jgi:transposase
LHLAFELGWGQWKLAFTIGQGQKARQRTMHARDLAMLEEEIAKAKKRFQLEADAAVVSCYEAGRDGFWLHRYLTARGISNVIVDSASIEVNRRKRRVKNDRLDAEKLVTMLLRYHGGERKVWSVVTVPSAAEEDQRQLHRELQELKDEQTMHSNRIKGLLASQGVALEDVQADLPAWLEMARLWDGSSLGLGLLRRLVRESQRWQFVHRQILVYEFFAWRKIQNRKQAGALVGLTGTPYHSGDCEREQGISKAGSRRMRKMLVELAWCWLRWQPESALSAWYGRRFAGGKGAARKVGIVALARKLLIALWRYLERGELPAGAKLVDWRSKIVHPKTRKPAA